jgi:hypothetical protein
MIIVYYVVTSLNDTDTPSYADRAYEELHLEDVSSNSIRFRKIDLWCFVRTAYSILTKFAPVGLADNTAISVFWEECFHETLWQDAMEAINSLTEIDDSEVYDEVVRIISQV